MSTKMVITVIVVVLWAVPLSVQAEDYQSPVTPYGDFCRKCSRYGICPTMLSIQETVQALQDYYAKKGYRAVIRSVRGRFVVAEIYKGKKSVDKIIFDRKTGRIRSIY